MLKGDHATVWGFLNHLRKLYPEAMPREHLAYLQGTLPYTSKEMVALEASLLSWIHSCGALSGLKSPPKSILEIEEELKNGTIYCKLVEFIFGKKLHGTFKDPKTESTKMSNLRKALEVLKKEKSMSQKYTWSEREILRGNRECILGLLEDMHILFDGFPPRQPGKNYFENGPHIGKVFDQMNRKPFYYHKDKEDTFELDSSDENDRSKSVKDYISKTHKFSSDAKNTRNKQVRLETQSTANLRINTTQEFEKGLHTDRPQRKHEEVPSIINNQMGQDVCSPKLKIRDKRHNFRVSPIKQTDDVFKHFISTEMPLPKEMSSDFQENNEKLKMVSNNQMSSKPVSGVMSPVSHTFQPNKEVEEESMEYTEQYQSEQSDSQNQSNNSKSSFGGHTKNPFSIDTAKADIDPFKEFINRHKSKLKMRGEMDMNEYLNQNQY